MMMHKSLVSVLTAAFAVVCHVACADSVDAVQAKTAASAWLVCGRAPKEISGRSVSAVTTLASDDAKMHVAKLDGGGFIVLSTDDLIDPIIAFSSTGGTIDPDARNPLWALLTRDLACRASVLTNAAVAATQQNLALASAPTRTAAQQRWDQLLATATASKVKFASTITEPRVDSFVPTRWNQTTVGSKNVYNYYTPNNYCCGCVATATAQIMRYFQWPTASVTAKTFTCSVSGSSGSYKMKGGVYDWSNMPAVPTSAITDTQAAAIGKLTYDIGCSVGMSWASGGSGASLYSARLRLLDTFGYASCEGVVFVSGVYDYSLERCKQVVIPCLDYGTPLGMSISGSGGHAVVVDGYGYSDGDFYLHVNCGWGGDSDAWYCPPDFKTSSYTFNALDGFIYQILPQETGTIISGRVLDASGVPVEGAAVTLKKGSTVKATATSGARGIYAVLAPSTGSYTVTATANGNSISSGISVSANNSKQLSSSGGYYAYSSYNPTIGNTYGNDLQITGLTSVDEPQFVPESCLFYPSTNVTITCTTSGATIRYTTDGSDPTESSAAYTGPITVTDDTTIKARAYKDGLNASAVVTATYTYDVAQGGEKGDYYAKPIVISGMTGSYVIADNTNYTLEENEAKHTLANYSYSYQYRTSWYKWTAPGSGTMTFTTKYTSSYYQLPSAVAIYSDSANLPTSTATRLAMSKDYSSSGDYTTSVSLDVTQGTVYRIVGVPMYDMAGTFTLSWSGDLTVTSTATSETDVPVPYSWLDQYFPGQGTSAAAYETLAARTGVNGYRVWQSYLAGLDPTDVDSQLQATIRIENGTRVVDWKPKSAVAAELGYDYKVKGKKLLSDTSWVTTNANSRFFKVMLEKK